MKLCPECDSRAICCDHCSYFEFNGDAEGCYTDNGWCRFHKRKEWPGGGCEEYVCFQLLNKHGVEPKHD